VNEERTGKYLWQVEHIRCHLWQRYSITVNQVMVVTVNLSKMMTSSLPKGTVHLYFFFWPLCCLFFEIRILIDPLVSANSSIGALEVCCLQINYQIEKIWLVRVWYCKGTYEGLATSMYLVRIEILVFC
jgi:hypothetical protein